MTRNKQHVEIIASIAPKRQILLHAPAPAHQAYFWVTPASQDLKSINQRTSSNISWNKTETLYSYASRKTIPLGTKQKNKSLGKRKKSLDRYCTCATPWNWVLSYNLRCFILFESGFSVVFAALGSILQSVYSVAALLVAKLCPIIQSNQSDAGT